MLEVWRYQLFVPRIHRSPVGLPQKGPVIRRFDVSFIVELNKLLANTVAGELRWYVTHVTSLYYLSDVLQHLIGLPCGEIMIPAPLVDSGLTSRSDAKDDT